MLNSILHTRLFCKVHGTCCTKFVPSARMYLLHNYSMYQCPKEEKKSVAHTSTDKYEHGLSNEEKVVIYSNLLQEFLDFRNGNGSECYFTLHVNE